MMGCKCLHCRYLGRPAFMEVPPEALLTDFVLDIIQSSAGETCDGIVEQVAAFRNDSSCGMYRASPIDSPIDSPN